MIKINKKNQPVSFCSVKLYPKYLVGYDRWFQDLWIYIYIYIPYNHIVCDFLKKINMIFISSELNEETESIFFLNPNT